MNELKKLLQDICNQNTDIDTAIAKLTKLREDNNLMLSKLSNAL